MERRKYNRSDLYAKVLLRHPDCGDQILDLRNLSDTGLLLEMGEVALPDIGSIVEVQFKSLDGSTPPMIKMEVVRIQGPDIGLKYCE